MSSSTGSTHKKYQPSRTDILWNTDWGIAKSELSSEEASARGLRSYQGRWVTPEEKRTLKDQYAAYRALRVIAGIIAFNALVFIIPLVILASKHRIANARAFACVIGSALFALVAVGLWRFERWARYAAIVLICLWAIVTAGNTSSGTPALGGLLMLILCLYYLCRGTAGTIFNLPRGGVASSSSMVAEKAADPRSNKIVDSIQ